MANIAGIRFREAGKVFYYDCVDLEVQTGSYVVVETSHGTAIGRVVITPNQVLVNELKDEVKPVLRLATQADIERSHELKEKAERDLDKARKRASEQELAMTFATAEYDLEGKSFTAYFTATERVDFRNLVRDLSRELGVKVQLLQVGDRDRAKLVDGMDICGQRLCCSSWMTSFPSVSIRMAKEQDLPLNPQKISGVCGRLYCCLTFEYEDYKSLRGTLPKIGSFVSTPAGEAKVSSIDFVREKVKLYLTEANQVIELAAVDLKLQHGVTVRPMELVHKVEGDLRPISEDRSESRRGGRRRRGSGEQLEAPSVSPAAEPASTTESAAGEQKRRRRRRRRGRGGNRGAPGAEGSQPTD
jgi:cell fate regulator YaaT (PSP1 superfamily)